MKWSSSARVENVSTEKANEGLLIVVLCSWGEPEGRTRGRAGRVQGRKW